MIFTRLCKEVSKVKLFLTIYAIHVKIEAKQPRETYSAKYPVSCLSTYAELFLIMICSST
jgi:hypothetical protein